MLVQTIQSGPTNAEPGSDPFLYPAKPKPLERGGPQIPQAPFPPLVPAPRRGAGPWPSHGPKKTSNPKGPPRPRAGQGGLHRFGAACKAKNPGATQSLFREFSPGPPLRAPPPAPGTAPRPARPGAR
ncbi:proline-rich proteoglycan 2-like [Penaeus monodon]|uniref:proline-rich proteoglycan 2-like n=1 Tax=Penaeus monodon TaxID=6687 RepID=UPI0018A7B005|nr:proline-rich proteoglycan 2-like [Penaeus monodon]